LLSLLLFFCLTGKLHAQQTDLEKLPKTKEEFVASEKDFIATASWLENNRIDEQADKRKLAGAWVLAWLTNSPTVTIEIHAALIKPFEKNPELLLVYMAGYGRYCLENNYSTDKLKCNVAAMKAVLHCYGLGGDFKKDKNLTKLADADKEGKLEEWVREAMEAK